MSDQTPDFRDDWPNKRPGDHMDADGRWRNAEGQPIRIQVQHLGTIVIDGPVHWPGNATHQQLASPTTK